MQDDILDILKDIQPGFDFENSADFVRDGYLDSFDVVTLVSELENKFSILISALEIVPENFSSIESIRALVERSAKKTPKAEK